MYKIFSRFAYLGIFLLLTVAGYGQYHALHSQKIGSAQNALTSYQLDYNSSLHSLTFIHRSDPSVYSSLGRSQFRYDFSTDSGNTWQINYGPITADTTINGDTLIGRYPIGMVYNPSGNTILSNAYMIYSGTWHNDSANIQQGRWMGQLPGQGRFSVDTATFDTHFDTINNGLVNIASRMCQSSPGIFWTVNVEHSGTFFPTSNQVITGLILEKGVWNDTIKKVNWSFIKIPQTFAAYDSNSITFSAFSSWKIAFDPTGQFGWIAGLGDISADQDSVYEPIFWKTTDSGINWTGPIHVMLDSMPEIMAQLRNNGFPFPASHNPSTTFEEDLVVDYLGNPHMVVTIGNGNNYSLPPGHGYTAWDITYNANFPACVTGWNGWRGFFLDSVQTFRGTLSSDGITQDNRPLASRSTDGKKVFFFWVDSDRDFIGSDANDLPNLFTRAFDLEHFSSTKSINLTLGDSLWGGQTANDPGGVIGAATLGTVAPIAISKGNNTINVPLVFTHIDYHYPVLSGGGSYLQPAAFWYINNLDFGPYDFTEGLSGSVTMDSSETIILLRGDSYVEYGATINYLDTNCYRSGTLHLVIDNSEVDTSTNGTYYVHYMAQDAQGNTYAAANRRVLVVSPPDCGFYFRTSIYDYRIQFIDTSMYDPTTYNWDFDDHTLATVKNPLHIYTNNGTYNVCLTASNAYGSCTECQTVTIIGTGIDEKSAEEGISVRVYPNPFNNATNIVVEGLKEKFDFEMYDVTGRLSKRVASIDKQLFQVNRDGLPSGVYFYRIITSNGDGPYGKLVIE